jgi:radical SAM superfamily enzyme YgiQ (UPF0313 family)
VNPSSPDPASPTPPISVAFVDISGLNWQQRPRRPRGPFAPKRAKAAAGPTFMFLPYAVGLLQVYAQRFARDPGRYHFLPTVFRRQAVGQAVDSLIGAQVVGFSTYCWNLELSLAIARELRARQPETLIVFGGPQVPDRSESFLREHPYIDVACHGEGEATFLQLLEAYPTPDWPDIGGISYLDSHGGYVLQPKRKRLTDLNEIPSPYLSGVFDDLMRDNPDISWHVLWETNRGCPFSCTFCDWGSAIASKVYQFEMSRLRAEVDWFADRRIEFIFVCDANYGILPRDLDLAEYIISVRRAKRYPWSLGVQNTKNATERAFKIQSLLASISTSGVTIALQSVDPHTLKSIKRDNISVASFQELQRRYLRVGIPTYTDVILGLPGETYESFANGVDSMIRNGQYNRLQFYNCYLLPNAEMASPADRERFKLETVRSRMVIDHEPIDPPPDRVDEYLELVVATSTMPRADWVRMKAFAWMTDLLHCNRLLQIPLVVAYKTLGVSYRFLIELFTQADSTRFPTVAGVQRFFVEWAEAVQRGGDEFCPSREWLDILWPADELALVRMTTSWTLDDFYLEAEQILIEGIRAKGVPLDPAVIHDAVVLNQHAFRVPFEIDDIRLDLDHDVLACYEAGIRDIPHELEAGAVSYLVKRTDLTWLTWEDWLEDLVRRQKDKPAFLYQVTRIDQSGEAIESAVSSVAPVMRGGLGGSHS